MTAQCRKCKQTLVDTVSSTPLLFFGDAHDHEETVHEGIAEVWTTYMRTVLEASFAHEDSYRQYACTQYVATVSTSAFEKYRCTTVCTVEMLRTITVNEVDCKTEVL